MTKLVKSKKLIGGAKRPTKNKAVGSAFTRKMLGEIGSLTGGEIYDFTQTREDEWLIVGENIDTGSVLKETSFNDKKKAQKAWAKVSISFHKRELKKMRKKRMTLGKRIRKQRKKWKRVALAEESDKILEHIIWTEGEIAKLEASK